MPLFILTALALSIGWGIRGNYGHEFGALLPGGLAALTGALLSGRRDWEERLPWFGFFGALGWSFGGSMSYMQVIAYTHSGHPGSILYGFASLFLIGFLWAALGGAGTALPIALNRRQLAELLPAVLAVFIAWTLQSFVEDQLTGNPDFRHRDLLYWYDTDWLAASTALLAVLLRAGWRRQWDPGTSLVCYMAIGWWLGFLILVNLAGWRMTPPRGDNWSGCVGMTLGLWCWLAQRQLSAVWLGSLVAGFLGGLGFAGAAFLQLLELKSGLQTNWHSILEQTYGLINGLGIALLFVLLRKRAAPVDTSRPTARWPEWFVIAFVLLGIPWLNLQKNPSAWTESKAIPDNLYGISTATWFEAGFLLFVLSALLVGWRHAHQPLSLVPSSARDQGKLLLVALLGIMVIGNFTRALPNFQPQRLVTEGVLHVNALVLALGILLIEPAKPQLCAEAVDWTGLLRRTAVNGLLGGALFIALAWMSVRWVYHDQPAGFHKLHIRFGPNATASKEKPRPDQPHP